MAGFVLDPKALLERIYDLEGRVAELEQRTDAGESEMAALRDELTHLRMLLRDLDEEKKTP